MAKAAVDRAKLAEARVAAAARALGWAAVPVAARVAAAWAAAI